MSDLSALLPPDSIPTLIGRDAFMVDPPSLLKWNDVVKVFAEFGSVLPLIDAFTRFSQSGLAGAAKVSDALDSLLKANLGETIHAAARTLLMTRGNVGVFIDRISDEAAKRVAREAKVLDSKGRWASNKEFANFIDDNLTTLQAFHVIRSSADLTQARDALGKLLPFIQATEVPPQSEG